MNPIRNIISLVLFIGIIACNSGKEKLPILGNKIITPRTENGRIISDTIYHTIPNFNLINQDSIIITESILDNKVTIADFFFTSCPTICPVMKAQLLRVYEAYQDNHKVQLLSHSIDPEHDTVALLRDYSQRLDVSTPTWHFLTGNKEAIYELGEKGYIVTAREDADEPGGFLHSGAFILIDGHKRIRGIYDGTKSDQVDRLLIDINRLLKEHENH